MKEKRERTLLRAEKVERPWRSLISSVSCLRRFWEIGNGIIEGEMERIRRRSTSATIKARRYLQHSTCFCRADASVDSTVRAQTDIFSDKATVRAQADIFSDKAAIFLFQRYLIWLIIPILIVDVCTDFGLLWPRYYERAAFSTSHIAPLSHFLSLPS